MTTVTLVTLKDYLLENVEELKQAARELNSWDGSFEEFDVWENDEEFFNTYFDGKPMEAVRAAQYGSYNFNDDYVRFNGYGNLESLDEYQLDEEIKGSVDEILEAILEEQHHLDLSSELEDLIEEFYTLTDEEEEEEEEEEE